MGPGSYTLYTPVRATGPGVGMLTLTDAGESIPERRDAAGNGMTATIDGRPVTIAAIQPAVGPQFVTLRGSGGQMRLSLVPTRIIVESVGIATTYIAYPDLPPGAAIVSVSLPPLFPDDLSLVLCIAAGTLVDTPDGPRPASEIAVGDLVETLDRGPQPVRWAGRRCLDFRGQPLLRRHAPVVISAGALGPGLPAHDLAVSPRHAVMLADPMAELLFRSSEVLVPAEALVNGRTIRVDTECRCVDYRHFLLDTHAIMRAEGVPVESLYLGDLAIETLNDETHDEVLAVFAELAGLDALHAPPARPRLNMLEARVLQAA